MEDCGLDDDFKIPPNPPLSKGGVRGFPPLRKGGVWEFLPLVKGSYFGDTTISRNVKYEVRLL